MGILRGVVGIACELLTIRDPYEQEEYMKSRVAPKVLGSYRKQNHTWDGKPVEGSHTVWRIQANDSNEAALFTKGTTIEGNRSRSIVHVGKNLYEIDVYEWDTSGLSDADEEEGARFSPLYSCLLVIVALLLCPAFVWLYVWAQYHPDLILR